MRATRGRLLTLCWLTILTRVVVLGGLVMFAVACVNRWDLETLYITVGSMIVVTFASYLYLAYVLRCSSCGARFFINTGRAKHPAARKAKYGDYWGTLVLDILRHGHFVCVYCGTFFHVHDEGDRGPGCQMGPGPHV